MLLISDCNCDLPLQVAFAQGDDADDDDDDEKKKGKT